MDYKVTKEHVRTSRNGFGDMFVVQGGSGDNYVWQEMERKYKAIRLAEMLNTGLIKSTGDVLGRGEQWEVKNLHPSEYILMKGF